MTNPELTTDEGVQLGRKVRRHASEVTWRARWRLWHALWKASDGWHAKGRLLRATATKVKRGRNRR